VAPDIGLPVYKLIDVELQRLRGGDVVTIEIHIVNEIVSGRRNCVICIILALRRQVANQVIVPETIGELRFATQAELGRISAERRRTHSLLH